MKYLEYNESTGNIYDSNKLLVCNMPGFTGIEIKESSDVDNLIKLKNARFTAEEIIQIKKAGLA